MRKFIFIIVIAVFLLTSCDSPVVPQAYTNSDTACSLGNTFYQSIGDYVCWNPEWTDVRTGLCFDPLCDHRGTESMCPENTWLWNKTIITDGKKLYLNVQNAAMTDINNTMYRQIYSMNPDGSGFSLLHTYDASGATSPVMQYSDGYLYYEQGHYRTEHLTNTSNTNHDDQYMTIMRIPIEGGNTEIVFDNEMDMITKFFVDDQNYYLIEQSEENKMALTIIDKENGVVKNDAAKNTEGHLFSIRIHQGKTYLLTSKPQKITGTRSDGTTAIKMLNTYILYLYENDTFRKINTGDFTFAPNGIWFSEVDCEYVGTKTMNSGAYGETGAVDFFAVTTKKLFNMNTYDYSIQEYYLVGEFSFGDDIEIISSVNEKLYVSISNQNEYYENGNSEYRTCMMKIDGTSISIEKVYE